MNELKKDKGLMKAVKEQPQFRLPSNFAYRTMQKVEEAVLLREKKQERRMLLAIIAASLCLIVSSSLCLYLYFGASIQETMQRALLACQQSVSMPVYSLYLFLCISLPLFMLFDRWMRKQYFKHHSS